MAKVAQKCEQKLGKLLKKGSTKIFGLKKSTRFLKKLKRPTKYFSKADTINLAQFLVRQSAAPSSAHQRGRASGVVDGIFHTGPPSLPPEPPLPDGHGQAPKDIASVATALPK